MRRAAADRGEGDRGRAPRGLAVRPDARQHDRVVQRVQDPPLRPDRRRGARVLRGAPRDGYPPGRAARRADRRTRHRVSRRRPGHRRRRPARPVRDRLRPAPEHPAVAGAGFPCSGDVARMIDLRSDTVTKPTPGMREAIAAAEVGDDVYAEDPTVNALQAEVAALFGHEAALFTPTGSMANQIAVQLVVGRAEELLCDADAHVVTYEIGAAAAIGGVSTRTCPALGGGMRQAGVLAAAGRYAFAHHVARLADDHARARRLAEALAPFGLVDPARVRTNIVPLDLMKSTMDGPALGAAARAHGVLVSVLGPRTARLVTHLDVDDAGIDRAIEVLTGVFS